MLAAILFDLDGTLVNTDPFHYKAWQEILREYGIEIDEFFYKTRISGRLNPEIIEDILPQLSLEEGVQFAEDKEARFRNLAPLLKPLAGLDEVMSWTKQCGLKRALVTNAPRKNVHFLLSVLGLTESFDSVILAEEAIAGKPDPAPYQLALNDLNITAEQALAFEDSPSGIRSSVGAGIRTIGIASTHDPKALYAVGAEKVVPDFTAESLWTLLKR
ncbi:HAD-IA family hydrolase [Microcoleus sp. FACHB-831]|jgi:beta-phosphoglucomutase|uniref:HAD family hydrolase n=1 Tax=Microcoleus sp. FACHB-831 TaxID=2692827 RepID=UPI0016864802|nr:HAD-IA family hydrolase [Microcoleus sp. FACHB-831]MBD1921356.1 HAD-IA family hydrolase [Microcoleus sp. FACHB-831]